MEPVSMVEVMVLGGKARIIKGETSRLYRLGEECISEVRDLGDLGSRTRTGLLSLGFGWPANLPAED